VSKRTVDLVGGLIRRSRKQLGTRWRKAARGRRRSSSWPSCATTSAWPTWPAATASRPSPSAPGSWKPCEFKM